MIDPQQNWSGHHTFSAARVHRPTSVEEIQELVSRGRKLKVFGARHSFNHIADSSEDLISLEYLNRILAVDPDRRTVTVEGGIRYGQLCPQLHQAGYALPNLASLPDVSIAGACATATHGSGDHNGGLATAVAGMELVIADGSVVELSREKDGEQFQGAVVGLGGLGVITKLTLDIVPAFEMCQDVYENLPLARLEEGFEAIFSSAYSVSLFTDWRSDQISQVWLKRQITDDPLAELEPTWFEATLAKERLHPVAGFSTEHLTEQMGIPGPWYDRLPHFRIDRMPGSGDELQTEYMVPRQHAVAALRVLNGLRERIAPLLYASEVRTIAADTLWMSPYYQRDTVALHFTWKKDWGQVGKLLPVMEEQLAPFNPRPHWGKLFTMPPARVQALYEKLPEFRQLLRHYDPQGKFRNTFLDTYIFGTG